MPSSSPPDSRYDPQYRPGRQDPDTVNLKCLFRKGSGSGMRYSGSGGL